MMKIRGHILPRELKKFFFTTFLMYLIGLSVLVPTLIYIVKPFLNLIFHGVPFSISQSKAISFDKVCYFVLFASLWISFIFWIRELVIWYRRVSKKEWILIKYACMPPGILDELSSLKSAAFGVCNWYRLQRSSNNRSTLGSAVDPTNHEISKVSLF